MRAALRVVLAALAWLCASSAIAETVPATLNWHQRAELGVPVNGVIESVDVSPGDRVKRGQVLLALDSRPYAAKVAAAKARLARVEPGLAEAARELERTQDMFDRTLLSEHDLEVAKIALARLEADRAEAKAALTLARLELERSVLRAPFAGVVVDRVAEPGETVIVNSATVVLITLAATDRLVARAHLKLSALKDVATGGDAKVLAEGREFAGKVTRVTPEPVSPSGQPVEYGVDVVFEPGPGDVLRIGQPVQIDLP